MLKKFKNFTIRDVKICFKTTFGLQKIFDVENRAVQK